MGADLWQQCVEWLERELPEQSINTWVRPLHAVEENNQLKLLAPNQFVIENIRAHCLVHIETALLTLRPKNTPTIKIEVGSNKRSGNSASSYTPSGDNEADINKSNPPKQTQKFANLLNEEFTFENFVQGKSNQLARAATLQVASNVGKAYNPLLIYGGVGLGKTHLMHAAGNQIIALDGQRKVVYLHSERFVGDMVKALQHNQINQFKNYYRSVDALLIDDIQFFAGKDRSQEEFFHTFNALLEGQHQVILTCDRYPKEVSGLEDRLKSRFGWGLSVAVEPPELETRVAILKKKAEQASIELPSDVAFFIAKRLRSNVRELEGALKRILVNMQFTGKPISLDLVRDALRDTLASHEKLVTVENIQKTVAEYYKIRVSDLLSARRNRQLSRPRQLAMALAKELTSHSLPVIGQHFGGKDHTTVLYACRKINELRQSNPQVEEDYTNLIRTLST